MLLDGSAVRAIDAHGAEIKKLSYPVLGGFSRCGNGQITVYCGIGRIFCIFGGKVCNSGGKDHHISL